MNRIVGLTLLFLTLFGVSCIKEDNDGAQCPVDLQLLYDWSLASSVQPTDSLLTIYPDGLRSVQQTDNVGTKLRLPAGTYTFVALEPTEKITLAHDTATVSLDENNFAVDPDPVSGGKTVVTLLGNGTEATQYLPMRYQSRELIIKINFIGLGISSLTAVDGVLSGITIKRKIDQGFPPIDGLPNHNAIVGGSKAYETFVHTDVGSPLINRFIGTQRLFGIDASTSQILSLILTFTSGTLDMSPDISSYLANFHTNNVAEPYVIEFTISINESFVATIVDWRFGSVSELDAH